MGPIRPRCSERAGRYCVSGLGPIPKDSGLGTPASKEAAYTKRESGDLWPMVRSARIQGRLGWPASDPHRRELIPASTLPISRQVDRAQGAFLILNSWT